MLQTLSKRKRLSKFASAFFASCVLIACQSGAKHEAAASSTSVEKNIQTFSQAIAMEQGKVDASWACPPESTHACIHAYVEAWGSAWGLFEPKQDTSLSWVSAVFVQNTHGWLDMSALPASALRQEAVWLMSLWQGLRQAFPKITQWSWLQDGQPRSVFSHSIVLPSVLDRDFIDKVKPLTQLQER